MATRLKLKKRDNDPIITLSVTKLQTVIEAGEAALLDFFIGVMDKEVNEYIHDKVWLETIVNWVSEGGLPLTTMSKWFKLTDKVNDLDDTKEGIITLSDFQVALIWGRLTDPKFKMLQLHPQFVKFIMDFQKVTGRHFEEEEPDEKSDKEK